MLARLNNNHSVLAAQQFNNVIAEFNKAFTLPDDPNERVNFFQSLDINSLKLKLKTIIEGEVLKTAREMCRNTVGVIEKITLDDGKKPKLGKFFTFVEYDESSLPTRFVMRLDYENMFECDLLDYIKLSEKIKASDMSYVDRFDEIKKAIAETADRLKDLPKEQRDAIFNALIKRFESIKDCIEFSCSIETTTKEESRIKHDLTQDDVESAHILLSVSDKFGIIDINEKRSLSNNNFMADFKENDIEKILRIRKAEEKNTSLSKNISSFFTKHPFVGSVAAGLVVGLGTYFTLSRV